MLSFWSLLPGSWINFRMSSDKNPKMVQLWSLVTHFMLKVSKIYLHSVESSFINSNFHFNSRPQNDNHKYWLSSHPTVVLIYLKFVFPIFCAPKSCQTANKWIFLPSRFIFYGRNCHRAKHKKEHSSRFIHWHSTMWAVAISHIKMWMKSFFKLN